MAEQDRPPVESCNHCGGFGFIEQAEANPDGYRTHDIQAPCPYCGGDGYVEDRPPVGEEPATAASRLRALADLWPRMQGHHDVIHELYGFGAHAELRNSDLVAVLDERDRLLSRVNRQRPAVSAIAKVSLLLGGKMSKANWEAAMRIADAAVHELGAALDKAQDHERRRP